MGTLSCHRIDSIHFEALLRTTSLLHIHLFVECNSLITLSLLSQFLCGHHPQVSTRHRAFSFRAPSSPASVLWVLLFHHRITSPFFRYSSPQIVPICFPFMCPLYYVGRGVLEGFVVR